MSVTFDLAWCFVADMERATSFYRDVLGMEVGFASSHWTTMKCSGGSLALHLADGDVQQPGGFTVSLGTDDIRALAARLGDSDLATVGKPHDTPRGAVLSVQDPDGNRLQVMQSGVFAADLA